MTDEAERQLLESDPVYLELVRQRDEAYDQLEQLRTHDKEATDLTIDQQVEIGRLATENERLRINLRDYRQKHPCRHAVMCWADELASKALGGNDGA